MTSFPNIKFRNIDFKTHIYYTVIGRVYMDKEGGEHVSELKFVIIPVYQVRENTCYEGV